MSWSESVNRSAASIVWMKYEVLFAGTCQCSGAYAGPSCAIPSGARPQVVMPNTVLCDSRHEDCAWAKIFGYNFHSEALIQVEAVLMEVGGPYCHVNFRSVSMEALYD